MKTLTKHSLLSIALSAALLAAAPIPDPAQRRSIALLQGDLPSPANPPSGCVFRTRCPQAEARCASADMQLREVAPGHLHACWKTAPLSHANP